MYNQRSFNKVFFLFFILLVGLLIDLIGFVIFRFIPINWIGNPVSLSQLSDNSSLSNAYQALSSIGAFIVGMPVTIGASIATLYVAHRGASSEEQLEKIERARDLRSLEEDIKNNYNRIVEPYQNIAISLAEFDDAARRLTIVFIKYTKKLYELDMGETYSEQKPNMIKRIFIESKKIQDIKTTEQIDRALDTLSSKINKLIDCLEEVKENLTIDGGFYKDFQDRIIEKIERTENKNKHYYISEIIDFRDCLLNYIKPLISNQSSRYDLLAKIDLHIPKYIFRSEFIVPYNDIHEHCSFEDSQKKSWHSANAQKHAAQFWAQESHIILGGLLWTVWKPDETDYHNMNDIEKKSKNDALDREMQNEMYQNTDYFEYQCDNEEPEFEKSDTEKEIDDIEKEYKAEKANFMAFKQASHSSSCGIPIGGYVLQSLAQSLPTKKDILSFLRKRIKEADKFKSFNDTDIEKLLSDATILCVEPETLGAVDFWKKSETNSISEIEKYIEANDYLNLPSPLKEAGEATC